MVDDASSSELELSTLADFRGGGRCAEGGAPSSGDESDSSSEEESDSETLFVWVLLEIGEADALGSG